MSGKENIIANILSEAEAEKDRILSAAKAKAEEISEADEEYIRTLTAQRAERAAANDRVTLARYLSVANMDVKKVILQAKRDEIEKVFSLAEKKILGMDEKAYTAFLYSLLENYAEEGDCVVVGERDKDKLTSADVAAYAAQKGLTLTYRADGKFSGGLILEGKVYDKNLTVAMLLKEYAEAHETEIAEALANEREK